MEKQEVSFAVLIKDGVVTQVGKSEVLQPCIHFGGSTKWYDGKMKGEDRDGQASLDGVSKIETGTGASPSAD